MREGATQTCRFVERHKHIRYQGCSRVLQLPCGSPQLGRCNPHSPTTAMFGVLADPSRGGCSGRLVAKHWPRRNQVVLAWIGKGSPFKASLSPRFAFERWQGPSCGLRNSASADSLPYFPQVLSGESNCSWVGGGCRPSCRRRILQSKAQKDVYSPTPSGKGSGEDPAVATLPFATDSQVYRRFYDTQKGDIFNKVVPM